MREALEFAASWIVALAAVFGWGSFGLLCVSASARQRLWAWLLQHEEKKNKTKKVSRPQTLSEYGREEYWQRRYKESSDTHEWYGVAWKGGSTSLIADEFLARFKKTDKIVEVGCGTSEWGEMARKAGFVDICNVDFSKECVGEMSRRFPVSEREEQVYSVAALLLPYRNSRGHGTRA